MHAIAISTIPESNSSVEICERISQKGSLVEMYEESTMDKNT